MKSGTIIRLLVYVLGVGVIIAYKAQEPEDLTKIEAIEQRCQLGCAYMDQLCRMATELNAESDCQSNVAICRKSCSDSRTIEAASKHTPAESWGFSEENPIETCHPVGEQEFLADLRCQDFSRPEVRRIEVRKEAHTQMPQKFEAKCAEKSFVLYFDILHCGKPQAWQAPKGLRRPLRVASPPKLKLAK